MKSPHDHTPQSQRLRLERDVLTGMADVHRDVTRFPPGSIARGGPVYIRGDNNRSGSESDKLLPPSRPGQLPPEITFAEKGYCMVLPIVTINSGRKTGDVAGHQVDEERIDSTRGGIGTGGPGEPVDGLAPGRPQQLGNLLEGERPRLKGMDRAAGVDGLLQGDGSF
ncbi:MAG: hypothetical protein RAO92_04935 [Candidatus Euphemobacter frigidus]|nr:hypothetical protein [Candidatus Euphemobacter frigidus]MDP8275728.1 hypothetical protein [Candidatus Euphemobacter frigidus]